METLAVLLLVVLVLLPFVSTLPDLASEAMRLEECRVEVVVALLPLALTRLAAVDLVVAGICGIDEVDEGRGVRVLLLPKVDDEPGTLDTRV